MFSKAQNVHEKKVTDSSPIKSSMGDRPVWRLLIVDDEPDIHTVTQMALQNIEFEGRSLEFLHAYSGAEAEKIINKEENIALILLDVVMETRHSGLDVAKYIRETAKNSLVRIVLRTGQPGDAPEESCFINYDINDYKEKTELDRKRLFTTVLASIRAYRDLIKIEEDRKYLKQNKEGLERVISASTSLFEARSLEKFAGGLLQQITSVLFIDSESYLMQSTTASAIADDPGHWKIIASTTPQNSVSTVQPESISQYINKVCLEKKSSFIDGHFIGYFEAKNGKSTIIFVENCGELNPLRKQLLDLFSMNASIAFENINLEKEITDSQQELILRLGEVLEGRSKETGNHVRRLAHLSHLLGKALGLSDEEANHLRLASPMHDMGKIAIPDAILMKPGKLSEEEFDRMKFHAEAGAQILSTSSRPLLKSAAIIAGQHHEKFDGSGYPQGLKGKNIHLYARIVAIADVFDALMHKRCYKESWELDEALDVIKQGRGTHFDPEVVDAFFGVIPQAVEILETYADA